jgi:tetratricopeptide (TPR) repeat protein
MKNSFLPFICFCMLCSHALLAQKDIKKIDLKITEGKYVEAGDWVKSARKTDSVKQEYYFSRGEMHRKLGHYDIALQYLDSILAIDPNSADALNIKGIVYAQKGDNAQGAELVKKAISIDPDKEWFYTALGGIYMNMNEWQQALDAFLKAYKMDNTSYVLLYNLGATYSNLEDYKNAVYYLNKSLDIEKHRLTYFELGYAYYQLDKYNKAIDIYSKGLEMKKSSDPYEIVTDSAFYYWRAQVWDQKGNDKKYNEDMEYTKDPARKDR